jgi:thiamine-monophosphate kinase
VAAALQTLTETEFAISPSVRCADAPEARIAVQAMGQVPRGAALTRNGARPGDQVWVSGTLGDAGAGLAIVQGRLPAPTGADREYLVQRLCRPTPRLLLGFGLRGIASAAIDVSDGIAGDADHVARRSGLSLRIEADRLPLSGALTRTLDDDAARRMAAFAGDDYELLFTAPARSARAVLDAAGKAGVAVTPIGTVGDGDGAHILDAEGVRLDGTSWDHFGPARGNGP